ncbi:MAG: thioredoxin family protein, partial [Caldimonas sp.]
MNDKLIVAAGLAALALAMPATPGPQATSATPTRPAGKEAGADHASSGIAWRHAASNADIDAAFAQARTDRKPVFLYWGASWCPPCNQVKATLFNRQDFIERSRAFVPVYVDGDSPGAQKVGARFHVSGYPTMLLFNVDGAEVTRVPGEVDPARYTELVTLGMNASRPVKAVLADAMAGGTGLGPNDWRLLAFYSWDTDEQQLVPRTEVPAMLKRLSEACPSAEAETSTRLWLKALAAADAKAGAAAGGAGHAASVERLAAVLGDAAKARVQFDVLVNNAADIVRATSARGTSARQRLLTAFDRAMQHFEADTTLSRADRIGALVARVDLARIDVEKSPVAAAPAASGSAARPVEKRNEKRSEKPVAIAPALLADVREQTAKVDREITDGYERQAVITAAAYLLQEAGLGSESDALLKSNLARSHSPYYLMSQLAGNARKRGDKAEA